MSTIASSGPSETDTRYWWNSRSYIVLLVAAMAIPLLWPRIPPLVDLLGHMGRYRVELDLTTSPTLARFYDFHWILAGNLGVDLLILPLGRVLGLEPAVKLIAIAIPVLGAIGLLWTAREVHGGLPPTAAAALPFLWGFPFAYGFINFSLAMSLALCAFALWLRLAKRPASVWNALLFAVVALLLWLCHAYGWAVFVVLVIGSEWPEHWTAGRLRTTLLKVAPIGVPLLMMLIWRGTAPPAPPEGWFNLSQKLAWIVSTLRDRWKLAEMLMVGVAVAMLIVALGRDKLRFERKLAIPAMMLAACFLILPEQLLGSHYSDARLVPYVFALAFIAIKPVRLPAMAIAALLLFLAKLATFTTGLWLDSRDIDEALVAVDQLPIGARVASIVIRPCGDWAMPKLSHIGGLVIVRRHGFSNEQWVGGGYNSLQTTPAYSGTMTRDPSEAARSPDCLGGEPLLSERLTEIPRATFDYVWVIDGGRPPVPAATLVAASARASLYKLN